MILLIAGLAFTGVMGQVWKLWTLDNQLTTPTEIPTTYEGEVKTFKISTAGVDDTVGVTITLTGIGEPNKLITVTTKLEMLKTGWCLDSGYCVYIDIIKPDNTLLTTITHDVLNENTAIYLPTAPFKTYTDTFTTLAGINGDYKIIPRITFHLRPL